LVRQKIHGVYIPTGEKTGGQGTKPYVVEGKKWGRAAKIYKYRTKFQGRPDRPKVRVDDIK